MEEMCEQMMMDHSSMEMAEMGHEAEHQDMNMMHEKERSTSSDCEMTVDCDCISEQEVFGTIAPTVLLNINVSQLVLSERINKTDFKDLSKSKFELKATIPYSPPPLFLANESFLI